MAEDSPDQAPGAPEEGQQRGESNRALWAVLSGFFGIFPLAWYFGVRALQDRQRAHEKGRDYPKLDTASAITGLCLGTLTFVVLVVSLVVVLGGSDDDSSASAASGSGTEATTKAETVPDEGGDSDLSPKDDYAVGDTFRDGNFAFRVVSAKRQTSVDGFTPQAGSAFVRVAIDATNVSAQPIQGPLCAPSFAGVVLIDDADRNYSVDTGTANLPSADDPYCTNAVQPGMRKRIVLVFTVPKSALKGIAGLGLWDPTESGDQDGQDSYYFVDARV